VSRATGSTIVISVSDSREGSSAPSPMIVCSRRRRPALSRYNFDVVVRSMRVPSASVCVTVVMPSPENGASRTIALTDMPLTKSCVCASAVDPAAASHAAAPAMTIR
jgi:hypothetical protein